ncbi:MAG: hypothetical protein GY792_16230 [Gammaproteobacteria bacterium]|nr:hypothetical protein [Gammaproteobacteria bacterium]
MELPGGLLCDGRLRRDYRFKTVTGELERALSESGFYADTLPQQVTRLLVHSLSEVAGFAVDEALCRSLSAGDRQFLVLQLEALIDASPRWITALCGGCGEQLQFQIVPGSLPMKPAGEGYPEKVLKLSIGQVNLRVPNGGDEEFVSAQASGSGSVLHDLLSRLLSSQGQPVDVSRLNDADLEALDQLLDEMSPQAGLAASIDCPHCHLQQEAAIDPYAWIVRETASLDLDIHNLAFHYHWSEQDILQLPRARRERYLQLIDRSLGKYRADDLVQGPQGGIW